MATLDDVYRKFGEASEAAQLLETELGNLLLADEAQRHGGLEHPDPLSALESLKEINRSTLGTLLRELNSRVPVDEARSVLDLALRERNRLTHAFFRQHNFRRNSVDGCTIMMADLESIHTAIFGAYKLVLLASGTDLDALTDVRIPTNHVKIP
jgi:hypothetical protein